MCNYSGLGVSHIGTRTLERKPQSQSQEGSWFEARRGFLRFRELPKTVGAQGGDSSRHGPHSEELGVLSGLS